MEKEQLHHFNRCATFHLKGFLAKIETQDHWNDLHYQFKHRQLKGSYPGRKEYTIAELLKKHHRQYNYAKLTPIRKDTAYIRKHRLGTRSQRRAKWVAFTSVWCPLSHDECTIVIRKQRMGPQHEPLLSNPMSQSRQAMSADEQQCSSSSNVDHVPRDSQGKCELPAPKH